MPPSQSAPTSQDRAVEAAPSSNASSTASEDSFVAMEDGRKLREFKKVVARKLTFQAQVTDLSDRLGHLTADLNEKIAAQAETIAALGRDLATANETSAAHSRDLSTAMETIATANKTSAAYSRDLSIAMETIAACNRDRVTANETIASLDVRVAAQGRALSEANDRIGLLLYACRSWTPAWR